MMPMQHARPKQAGTPDRRAGFNAPLLLLAILTLLAALWAGWIRLGWAWPVLQPSLPMSHGPLMVSGFLGTLISLERAVALKRRWATLSPLATGLGGLALLVGAPGTAGPLLITLGSLILSVVFVAILRRHMAAYTLVMALGALAWLIGNLLWLAGRPIFTIVLWWAGFLILTIAGERLELGRLVRLSRQAQAQFFLATGLFLAGLMLSIFSLSPGTRLASAGMLAMAAWLLRYDIARRTIRKAGLPRFAAVCLLGGYVWLGAAGLLGLINGALPAGPLYDAYLHAIFVGFIFSMIFGHAPIIFPAILGVQVTFSPFFYAHVALLHISLALRLAGDLAALRPLRLYGGLLNGIAILLFLALTGVSILRAKRAAPASKARTVDSPSILG